MTAICFVCNLPILSHQVGLVWAGGNGWDELTRSTLEENTLRQRLGSRRDSAAQVSCLSPPEPDVADQPRGTDLLMTLFYIGSHVSIENNILIKFSTRWSSTPPFFARSTNRYPSRVGWWWQCTASSKSSTVTSRDIGRSRSLITVGSPRATTSP